MAKEELIEMRGRVEEILPDSRCRVKLVNGHELVAYTGGKMKKHRIRIIAGDDVTLAAWTDLHRAEARGEAPEGAEIVEVRLMDSSWGRLMALAIDAPLANGLRQADRTVPSFSLDGGLVFERDASYFGRRFRQTLEPRAFYVYTPFRDQNRLPNYDSGLTDFNFATIYTENAFGGNDRISDTNTLTLGVTSRLIDPATGRPAESNLLTVTVAAQTAVVIPLHPFRAAVPSSPVRTRASFRSRPSLAGRRSRTKIAAASSRQMRSWSRISTSSFKIKGRSAGDALFASSLKRCCYAPSALPHLSSTCSPHWRVPLHDPSP